MRVNHKQTRRRRHKKQKQLHIPKFIKFKKFFQGNLKGTTNFMNTFTLQNGHIGLRAVESGYLTITHYDLLKKFLSPVTKNHNRLVKTTNIWVRFFTDRTITQKPLQSRMGRGKGLPGVWYSKIYAGQLLIEIRSSISIFKSKKALRLVSKKLPLLTQIIVKADQVKSSVALRNDAIVSNIIDKESLPLLKILELQKIAESTNQVVYLR